MVFEKYGKIMVYPAGIQKLLTLLQLLKLMKFLKLLKM
jgi:hypothetical protein